MYNLLVVLILSDFLYRLQDELIDIKNSNYIFCERFALIIVFHKVSHLCIELIAVSFVKFLLECLNKTVVYENKNVLFTDLKLPDYSHELIE